jgi:hypothetical protein
MKPFSVAAAAALGVIASACVSNAVVGVPDDHPASPRAAVGAVDLPSALAGYKSAEDFETPTAAPAQITHGDGTLGGMRHGSMPGMTHGGAPMGAQPR